LATRFVCAPVACQRPARLSCLELSQAASATEGGGTHQSAASALDQPTPPDQSRSTSECPRQESNLRTRFRKPLLYPLSYGGFWLNQAVCRLVGSIPSTRPPANGPHVYCSSLDWRLTALPLHGRGGADD